MQFAFTTDPREFLGWAHDYLAADPVLTTVVATASRRIAYGLEAGVEAQVDWPRWWLVVREEGRVVAVAMRTANSPPHVGYLLPMSQDTAVRLARTLHDRGEVLTAVNGALPAVRLFAHELARLTSSRVVEAEAVRLYELRELRSPAPAPGRLRLAGAADLGQVVDWWRRFFVDAAEQAGHRPGAVIEEPTPAILMRRIASRSVWLWEDEDGLPVQLTSCQPPAYGVARIGPVFTPVEQRGNGYASNAVAALARRLLSADVRPCLFTDVENPVSNRIYLQLGFRPVVDMLSLELV